MNASGTNASNVTFFSYFQTLFEPLFGSASLTDVSSENASGTNASLTYYQTLVEFLFGPTNASLSNVSLTTDKSPKNSSLTNSSSNNARTTTTSSNSAYGKNSPGTKVTFVSYVQTLLEPLFINLQGPAIFVCLLFHWVLLSIIFGMLPISYSLRKISKHKVFISIATNVLFYVILILSVYFKIICSPCKMYQQFDL